MLPAWPFGPHPAIETDEFLSRLGRGEQRDRQPGCGRNGDGDEHEVSKISRLVAVPLQMKLQVKRDGSGGDHRRNFRPCVDAPPEPAQQEHRTRARSRHQQQLPRAANGAQIESEDQRNHHQQQCRNLRGGNIVALAAIAHREAAIEIIDDIRRTPVQLRADGGHVGGRECREHETAQVRREDIRIHQRPNVARLLINQFRVKHERSECC